LQTDNPGGDIVPWPELSPHELRVAFEHRLATVNQWERLAIPTVVAVQGLCFGGGFELAIRSDVVFAGETARFGHPEQSLGIVSMLGGIYRAGMSRILTHLRTSAWRNQNLLPCRLATPVGKSCRSNCNCQLFNGFSQRAFAACFAMVLRFFAGIFLALARPPRRPSSTAAGFLSTALWRQIVFFYFSSRNPHDMNGVTDHVGGAALTVGASGHDAPRK
jgi:Enoyl-CoA hydratase/isomerase